MNYGFWLLLGQSAQTTVMSAQLRQLGGIADELTVQRLAHQYQALLAQVLVETEQATHRISSLWTHDRFAAAIHARLRLNAVQNIHPGLFDRYETKRAWAAATDQLGSLWSAIDRDPQWGTFGRNVVQAIDTLRQWQSFVGDPQARLSGATAEADRAERVRKRWRIMPLVTFAGGLLLLIVGAAAKAEALGGIGAITMLLGPVGSVFMWIDRASRARRAKKHLADFQLQLAQFNAFLADPLGGKLLDQVASKHPALVS
jgi:hypothetical protein